MSDDAIIKYIDLRMDDIMRRLTEMLPVQSFNVGDACEHLHNRLTALEAWQSQQIAVVAEVVAEVAEVVAEVAEETGASETTEDDAEVVEEVAEEVAEETKPDIAEIEAAVESAAVDVAPLSSSFLGRPVHLPGR